jgi:uncharacterized membrane protein
MYNNEKVGQSEGENSQEPALWKGAGLLAGASLILTSLSHQPPSLEAS